ncbi:Protein Y17G7B.23 b [Aphelenchoides avenae]|nr:Protein Y17G7B.23 b [Aphelenchus avenae]
MKEEATCLYCTEYDGVTGKCRQNANQNKYKCTGNWCVKVEGRINGHWTEMRGCAPFNPLAGDACVKIKTTQLSTFMGTDAIAQKYDLTQCFCNSGSRCNGVSRPPVVGSSFIFFIAAVLFILPR